VIRNNNNFTMERREKISKVKKWRSIWRIWRKKNISNIWPCMVITVIWVLG